MSLSKKYKRQPLHFEVIPIIDVMFTLLIFFVIYASTVAGFSNKGIPLQLPEASSASTAPKNIHIDVDSTSTVWMNGQQVPIETLTSVLMPLSQTQPKLPVVLRADKQVAYALVIRVLDLIQQSGFHEVSLGTETSQDGTPDSAH